MKKTLLALLITTALTNPVWAVNINEQMEITGGVQLIYGTRDSEVEDGAGNISNEKVDGFAAQAVTLGAVYKPNEHVDATISALYEEEIDGVVTDPEIDQAFVTWHARPDDKLDISAGNQYLPFGKYETAMVHDPLTLDLGEGWRDKTLTATSKQSNLTATGFAFAAEATQTADGSKHDQGYGIGISYDTETAHAGVDYINNLGESGGFADVNNSTDVVPGVAVHGSAKLGRVTVLGEHIMATKSFQTGDLADADGGSLTAAAKPSATHIEADIDLNNDRTLAMSWNKTKDADTQLDLAEKSYGITYRQPIMKGIEGAVELMQATDYDDLKSKSVTAQIAYEF
ncbi:MAG: hypothetical protein RL122_1708 [Pseudomonadota bacterium]|jgi:hypothetical protein